MQTSISLLSIVHYYQHAAQSISSITSLFYSVPKTDEEKKSGAISFFRGIFTSLIEIDTIDGFVCLLKWISNGVRIVLKLLMKKKIHSKKDTEQKKVNWKEKLSGFELEFPLVSVFEEWVRFIFFVLQMNQASCLRCVYSIS